MFSLFRYLSLTLLLALPLTSAFAATAYVDSLSGTLTAQSGATPARALKVGDTFDAGVTLATGAKSNAVLKFEDGQVVTLAPETRFAVREYRYNARSVKDSNIVFALLQGGLRFVTGVIGSTNHNAFKLNVGTATIGVRGSDGWASFIENAIVAAVNAGALTYTTSAGTALMPAGTAVVVNTQQAVTVPLVAPRAQAQQRAQQAGLNITAVTGALAAAAQAQGIQIPINTPVIVAAAAQAAVAVATSRAAAALAAAAPTNEAAQRAAAQAAALAAAAVQTAADAAASALQAAVTAGAVPPAPPAPTPQATPLPPPAPPTNPQQVQAQAVILAASIQTQTALLQVTQQSLNLPVTAPATILNAAPVTPVTTAPTPVVTPIVTPTPVSQ